MTRKLLLVAWALGCLGLAVVMALLTEPPRCTDAMQMVQDCRGTP